MAQKHTGDTDSKRSAVVKGEPAEARRGSAPKLHVGSATSARDRDADRSSMKQVRITFVSWYRRRHLRCLPVFQRPDRRLLPRARGR